MMFLGLSLIAAAIAPVASAAPPPAATAAQVDPARLVAAMALLDAQDFEKQSLETAEMGFDAIMASVLSRLIEQHGDELPDAFLARFRTTMHDHFMTTTRSKMSSTKQAAAAIYAREFTREELARMTQIAADPVMMKAREKSKIINPQLMALGMKEMRDSEPELEAKIERLVEEFEKEKKASHSTS